EGERGDPDRASQPVWPWGIRYLAAQRSQRQRGTGVHQYARTGDEADQGLPARERQQEEQAEQERHDQAEPRDAILVGPSEDLRVVPVAGQTVADTRG